MSGPIQNPGTTLTVWLMLFLILSACRDQRGALQIESGVAQLFIDDYLIENAVDIKRTLHQPLKDDAGQKPVIALENEFGDLGATLEANGSIVFDPQIGKYVMIALAFSPEGRTLEKQPRWTYYRLYRFTSTDGLHWIKGDDGTPQWIFPRKAEDLYDPQSGTSATNIDAFSCYYDKQDHNYPYKGWQHFANWGDDREGHYYLKSKNGIEWERGPMVVNGYGDQQDPVYQKIHQDGRDLVGPGDVTIFYHDPLKERFLGIFKFYSPQAVENENRLRSRAYAFFSHPLEQPFDVKSIDHVELLPPAADTDNDGRYDEYYGSTAWRYASMWLGGLKIWHGEGDYAWSAAGCAYLKLVHSRDGLHWQKVSFDNDAGIAEVFIPNGPEGGNQGQNDGGYITEFSQGPLKKGNELIIYYGSSSYGKNHATDIRISGGGIFRARLRIDGFVSVDKGTLTTKILRFSGNDLYLNALGPVTIEVLDDEQNPIAAQSVSGDKLKHRITFNGQTLAQLSKGEDLRLRFHIGPGGKLYSFTIQ
jgi:hypothetical protein